MRRKLMRYRSKDAEFEKIEQWKRNKLTGN